MLSQPLPDGVRQRLLSDVNGLEMHILEAGDPRDPLLLLLHGFPELAYSWRKLIPPLAAAGYHVVAPDQRGYGATTGYDPTDLSQFRLLNLVRDALGLVSALGHSHAAAVVGHDFGSPVAAWCALVRPDIFRSVVLMSAPFPGTPTWPLAPRAMPDLDAALAALDPPRKHYQRYYSTNAAAAEMDAPPQGLHAFLRAYYHVKSADWAQNRPEPLKGWRADDLANLPSYYVMERDKGMAETAAAHMPTPAEIAACDWLTDAELDVYTAEYARTGFGPGLLWYRAITSGRFQGEFELFAGRRIEVPGAFIAGSSDWGIHQSPGTFEAMQARAFVQPPAIHLVDGAGHWVQQEQPEAVTRLLLDGLRSPVIPA
jgi:pimeloyl-ACP methyl ester carboxylesterase